MLRRFKQPTQVTLHPDRLSKPLHWRKPRVALVSAMGDLFHEDVPDEFLDDVWATMGLCEEPDLRKHTWLLLTKRPQRMRAYAESREKRCMVFALPNLWAGITVCDQQEADEKIPLLLSTPAAHRWISVEPMLGPIAMGRFFVNPKRRIDWVVAGGESLGSRPGRPTEPEWFHRLEEQCVHAHTPYYLKQVEALRFGDNKRVLVKFKPHQSNLPSEIAEILLDGVGGER